MSAANGKPTKGELTFARKLRELWWEGVVEGWEIASRGGDHPADLMWGCWDDGDDGLCELLASFHALTGESDVSASWS